MASMWWVIYARQILMSLFRRVDCNYNCVHMPLVSICVTLGDKKQARLPAVRPFTQHLPSFNCVASQSHLPPCTVQCPGTAELVQAYHLFTEDSGASVLKTPISASFFFLQCFICNIQCIHFIFNGNLTPKKRNHILWGHGTGIGFDMRSSGHICMQNWTLGHNEQDDVCTWDVCYQTGATFLHLKRIKHGTAIESNSVTVSLPYTISTDDPVLILKKGIFRGIANRSSLYVQSQDQDWESNYHEH